MHWKTSSAKYIVQKQEYMDNLDCQANKATGSESDFPNNSQTVSTEGLGNIWWTFHLANIKTGILLNCPSTWQVCTHLAMASVTAWRHLSMEEMTCCVVRAKRALHPSSGTLVNSFWVNRAGCGTGRQGSVCSAYMSSMGFTTLFPAIQLVQMVQWGVGIAQ